MTIIELLQSGKITSRLRVYGGEERWITWDGNTLEWVTRESKHRARASTELYRGTSESAAVAAATRA